MEDLEILLSDEFVEFSRKISALAEGKKKEKQEFEKVYEAFKKKIKSYDEEAKKLQLEFEQWKKEKSKKSEN